MAEISAIIAHGDLTDIPFIEKTLGTRLRVEPAKTYEGRPDPQRVLFQAERIDGVPVQVDVNYIRSKVAPSKFETIGYIAIYDDHTSSAEKGAFMEDCIDIPARTVSSYFGGVFMPIIAADDPSPYGTTYRQQTFRGINKTRLQLGFSSDFMRDEDPVVAIQIDQVSQNQ